MIAVWKMLKLKNKIKMIHKEKKYLKKKVPASRKIKQGLCVCICPLNFSEMTSPHKIQQIFIFHQAVSKYIFSKYYKTVAVYTEKTPVLN